MKCILFARINFNSNLISKFYSKYFWYFFPSEVLNKRLRLIYVFTCVTVVSKRVFDENLFWLFVSCLFSIFIKTKVPDQFDSFRKNFGRFKNCYQEKHIVHENF